MRTKLRAVVLAILPAAALVATMAVGAGTATAAPDPVLKLYPEPDGQGFANQVDPELGCVNLEHRASTESVENWSDYEAILFTDYDCQDEPITTVRPYRGENLYYHYRIASVLFVENYDH